MIAKRFRRLFDASMNADDLFFRAWLTSIGESHPSTEDWQAAWAKFNAHRQHGVLCRYAHRRWLRRRWRAFKTSLN